MVTTILVKSLKIKINQFPRLSVSSETDNPSNPLIFKAPLIVFRRETTFSGPNQAQEKIKYNGNVR
jgi:hypothetical protein